MSDMKDLLSSTVGNLVGKVKDFSASDTVNDAIRSVRNAAASTGVLGVYEKGAQRVKSFGSATKLTVDLNRDHTELQRVFAEIGRLCYEQNHDNPEGFFAPLFEQVEALRETIAAKEESIARYKAQFSGEGNDSSPDAGSDLKSDIADFDSIVDESVSDR